MDDAILIGLVLVLGLLFVGYVVLCERIERVLPDIELHLIGGAEGREPIPGR